MESLRTLTVVKTDIRRFTDRVQQMKAEELDAFLREHRALFGSVHLRYGGNLIKEIGDSYLVTFESSTNALLACIALKRELSISTSGQSPSERTEIRIAVTAGDVLLQDGDIFGTPVNAVARVEALAPPGEIYFTEAVYQNLNRNEVASEFLGTFTLKGITVSRAAFLCDYRGGDRSSLSLDERLLRQLAEDLRAALHIQASSEPLDGFVATKAAELGLGTIVRVIPALDAAG